MSVEWGKNFDESEKIRTEREKNELEKMTIEELIKEAKRVGPIFDTHAKKRINNKFEEEIDRRNR